MTDLVVLKIQRFRDHCLASSYSTVLFRVACRLVVLISFQVLEYLDARYSSIVLSSRFEPVGVTFARKCRSPSGAGADGR